MNNCIRVLLIIMLISIPIPVMAQCISCDTGSAMASANDAAVYQQGVQITKFKEHGVSYTTTETKTGKISNGDDTTDFTVQDTKTKNKDHYTDEGTIQTMFGSADMISTSAAAVTTTGSMTQASASATGTQSLSQSQSYTFANGAGTGTQSYSGSQSSSASTSVKK